MPPGLNKDFIKETLYLHLRTTAPEATLAAALWSAEGGLQNVSGSLSEIAARAAGRRLIVFVPAADVRLASVEVPARAAQKVLQAAPYALEEQLAEDLETLHFALGPRQGASYPVAIVSRALMDQWTAALAGAGLRAQALVPEQLALPWTGDETAPPSIQLLAEPGEFIARSSAFGGFSCAPEDLSAYLQIADPEARLGLRVFVTPDYTPELAPGNRPVELLPGHRSALEVLVKHYRPEAAINLLQGSYSPREEFNRHWGPWRVPAALAAGWLLVVFASAAVQTWRLGRQASAQDAHNVERFQQLFPDEKKIVDLSAQLEQKVAALRGSGGSQGLLKLLEPTAAALTAVPGFAVHELQYRDGALYLNLTGKDLQSLEALRGWFSQHPAASLEVQSANAGTNGVQIRLKLTPA